MIGGLGCHAQTPPASPALTQEQLNRRIEVIVRSHFDIPPDVIVHIGVRGASDLPGYHIIPVTLTQGDRTSPPFAFEISDDSKTFLRVDRYDLSMDPKLMAPTAGRPARGPANAPVTIVSYDDLECPYCSQMHAQLFPDAMKRYDGKLRIIYRDFPLMDLHPWALHAAVDVNCLAAQSEPGYWNLVDYIHAHGAEITGTDNKPETAFAGLDKLTADEGARQKVNLDGLKACVAKQDTAAVLASVQQGIAIGVESTPTLFINGEKMNGARTEDLLWKAIDRAMTFEGVPPPAVAK